jgi:hypothetical protein
MGQLTNVRKLADTAGYTGCLNDLHAFANYINTILVNRDVTAAESLLFAAGYESSTSTDDSDEAWVSRRIGLESITETPATDFQVSQHQQYDSIRPSS